MPRVGSGKLFRPFGRQSLDHFKYQVMPGFRFFSSIAPARKFAQAQADATGREATIRSHFGKGTWHVKPKRSNPSSFYEVLVGNIGAVHKGSSYAKALSVYNTYVKQSKSGTGRAGGEQVSLWKDGEPIREHDETEPGYESNPRGAQAQIPRGKWINAKVRITKDGKVQAQLPRSAVKNPSGHERRGLAKYDIMYTDSEGTNRWYDSARDKLTARIKVNLAKGRGYKKVRIVKAKS